MSKEDTYFSFNKMYFGSFKGIGLFVYFIVKMDTSEKQQRKYMNYIYI